MTRYYVNTNAQANGDHEVHQWDNCPYPADLQNRLDLGFHATCRGAVREAKKHYPQSNGCYYCANECHTG